MEREERIKEIAIRISNSLFEIGDISCGDRECTLTLKQQNYGNEHLSEEDSLQRGDRRYKEGTQVYGRKRENNR